MIIIMVNFKNKEEISTRKNCNLLFPFSWEGLENDSGIQMHSSKEPIGAY